VRAVLGGLFMAPLTYCINNSSGSISEESWFRF
jgi:hypothetical protein